MSAFMVDKLHIDHILRTAIEGPADKAGYWHGPRHTPSAPLREPLDERDQLALDILGESLVKENLASINARYPDTVSNPAGAPGPIDQYWHQPYHYKQPARRLTTVEAIKALDCYEYQSCEHETWEQSPARKFCEQLRHALTSVLPDGACECGGLIEAVPTQYYNVFVRTWWRRNPAWPGGREPGAGKRRYIARHVVYSDARAICKQYNDTHEPGFLSKKAEFESI